MPAKIAVYTFDSLLAEPSLQSVEPVAEILSLDQVSSSLPAGAYTTFRTYQGFKALRLQDHFKRLEETAQLAGVTLPIHLAGLRSAVRQGLALFRAGFFPGAEVDLGERPAQDVRIRLSIDLEQNPGQAYLAIEPLRTPEAQAYLEGVSAITVRLERQLPEAKLTRFIQLSQPVRQSLPAGINEALMVNKDGVVTEGLSSNFFAILQGQVWTAGQGVLAGVTRSLVMDCIRQLGHPLVLEPVFFNQLPDLQEAFITSSSRGLLPLSQIDQTRIGGGLPGPITRRLMAAFEVAVADQVQAF